MSDGEVPYRIAATFGLGEGSRRRSKEESSLSSTLAIFLQ
jgi:hypothetical protein